MLCGSDKYVFSSRVVQLNPSTQHTTMVHTMHIGTQNVYFLPVEHSKLVRKLASTFLGLASRDTGYIEGVWCAFISVYAMCSSKLAHTPTQVFLN